MPPTSAIKSALISHSGVPGICRSAGVSIEAPDNGLGVPFPTPTPFSFVNPVQSSFATV
jgi:hypothetical protein